jgi:hypothetical protein
VSQSAPFNPLDKRNLGASVAEALLERAPEPLGKLAPFRGAGVYAIYYSGSFHPYAAMSKRNAKGRFEAPIYVGKAIPEGGRKGGALTSGTASKALYKRLCEHAESIRATDNLDISDFHCRHLVVDDIWIPLGEQLLIAKFAPIWNQLIDGFGNHDPGSGRYQQIRSRWDVLHPGRSWAMKCQERSETARQIGAEIEQHLRSTPIPTAARFYAEQPLADYGAEE